MLYFGINSDLFISFQKKSGFIQYGNTLFV